MTELDRRSFLKTSAAAGAGAAVLGGPLAGFLAQPALSPARAGTTRTCCGTCRTCATARCGWRCRLGSPTARSSRSRRNVPTQLVLDDGSGSPAVMTAWRPSRARAAW